MGTWNGTDEPLAFLITFRTYGTWLAGDERGSIDKYHNKYGGPRAVASPARNTIHTERLKSEPFLMNYAARNAVRSAINAVCEHRKWTLNALAVRTNHVHAVVSGTCDSGKILNDFKSYSTRRLREANVWRFGHSPWVDKGSRRWLWTESHIERAADYVANGQGEDLPDFD